MEDVLRSSENGVAEVSAEKTLLEWCQQSTRGYVALILKSALLEMKQHNSCLTTDSLDFFSNDIEMLSVTENIKN